MRLEELAISVPNGFHDAQIERIEIDYPARSVSISLLLWVDQAAQGSSFRELYQRALLRLDGVEYFAIELPDPAYTRTEKKHRRIDLAPEVASELPSSSPSSFRARFFIPEHNSFIRLCATSARLDLLDEPFLLGKRSQTSAA